MMQGLFTREPSFCGNTGYNGYAQQPCGLQVLPINKRGGYKGNTYLYIYITPDSVRCRFKKAATGFQKKYQLNQWCYRCCHVARFFENSQGNYRGRLCSSSEHWLTVSAPRPFPLPGRRFFPYFCFPTSGALAPRLHPAPLTPNGGLYEPASNYISTVRPCQQRGPDHGNSTTGSTSTR